MRMLTAAAVRTIRTAVTNGTATMSALARQYGVHESTVTGAVYGRTWRQVTDPGPLPAPPATGRRPANTRLTPARVEQARHRWMAGESISAIAADLGVAESTARSAIHGLSWVRVPDAAPIRPVGGRSRQVAGARLAQARRMRQDGATMAQIGVALGVAQSTVSRALS